MNAFLATLTLIAGLLISPEATLANDTPPGPPRPELGLEVQLIEIELRVLIKQYEKVQELLAAADLEDVLARDREEQLPEAEREAARTKREAASRRENLRLHQQKLRTIIKRQHDDLLTVRKLMAGQ